MLRKLAKTALLTAAAALGGCEPTCPIKFDGQTAKRKDELKKSHEEDTTIAQWLKQLSTTTNCEAFYTLEGGLPPGIEGWNAENIREPIAGGQLKTPTKTELQRRIQRSHPTGQVPGIIYKDQKPDFATMVDEIGERLISASLNKYQQGLSVLAENFAIQMFTYALPSDYIRRIRDNETTIKVNVPLAENPGATRENLRYQMLEKEGKQENCWATVAIKFNNRIINFTTGDQKQIGAHYVDLDDELDSRMKAKFGKSMTQIIQTNPEIQKLIISILEKMIADLAGEDLANTPIKVSFKPMRLRGLDGETEEVMVPQLTYTGNDPQCPARAKKQKDHLTKATQEELRVKMRK